MTSSHLIFCNFFIIGYSFADWNIRYSKCKAYHETSDNLAFDSQKHIISSFGSFTSTEMSIQINYHISFVWNQKALNFHKHSWVKMTQKTPLNSNISWTSTPYLSYMEKDPDVFRIVGWQQSKTTITLRGNTEYSYLSFEDLK